MHPDAGLPVELRAYRPLVEVGGALWGSDRPVGRAAGRPALIRDRRCACLQQYVQLRVQSFAHLFARRLGAQLTSEQVDYLAHETLNAMAQMHVHEPQQQQLPQQSLRLVLRHDCQ
jgi:hypothetical protein